VKLVWVAVLTGSLISGAGRAHAETRVGILVGVGITTLHQGEVLLTPGIHCGGHDYNPTTHFAAGGVVEFGWGGRLALRLEPMYGAKGSHFEDPVCVGPRPPGYVPPPRKRNDLRLSYLELPVLLVVSTDGGRLRPYLLTGPTVGYLASASQLREGQEQDVSQFLRRWDFGVGVGGGLRFTKGKTTAFVEGRYEFGLLSVGESIHTPSYNRLGPYDSSDNRGAQFLAGVTYEISHR
jgi:hypothetical protein